MKNELRIKNIYLFLVLIFLVASDQISKYIIRTGGGFYICNEGIAFGLQFPLWLYWIFLAFFLLFLNFEFRILNFDSISNVINFKNWKLNHWDLIGNSKFKIRNLYLVIILSGATSNIIDRIYLGCVIDFIDLKYWPVFNLADVFIVLGAIIILTKISKIKSIH